MPSLQNKTPSPVKEFRPAHPRPISKKDWLKRPFNRVVYDHENNRIVRYGNDHVARRLDFN